MVAVLESDLTGMDFDFELDDFFECLGLDLEVLGVAGGTTGDIRAGLEGELLLPLLVGVLLLCLAPAAALVLTGVSAGDLNIAESDFLLESFECFPGEFFSDFLSLAGEICGVLGGVRIDSGVPLLVDGFIWLFCGVSEAFGVSVG